MRLALAWPKLKSYDMFPYFLVAHDMVWVCVAYRAWPIVCGTQGIAIGGSEEAATHVAEEPAAEPRAPDKPPTNQVKVCEARLHASEEAVLKSYQRATHTKELPTNERRILVRTAGTCFSHTKVTQRLALWRY